MFENESARRDFLAALKAGRISEGPLQKAMEEVSHFRGSSPQEIVPLLVNPNPGIKQFARRVFAQIEDEAKVDVLFQRFENEKQPALESEWAAAIAICRSPKTFTALGKMANAKQPDVRLKALRLLVRQEQWHKHRPLVINFLQDPRPEVAETALKEVAAQAPAPYVVYLRKLAFHDKAEVRSQALQALIALGKVEDAAIFIKRIPFEADALRAELGRAFGQLLQQDPKEVTGIVVASLGDMEAKVRAAAMHLFLKLPDKRAAFRELLVYAETVSSQLRDDIYMEASQNADLFADLTLDLVKTEKEPALRLQAMLLAKILKHQKLAPLFIHEMKNPDWMVRYQAMQTLGDMKAPQAIQLLVDALNQPESSLAAIQALDKYRDIRLAKFFFQKLNTGHETERLEIFKALTHIPDQRFVPHLMKFLESPNLSDKVKKACAETVIEIAQATNTPVPDRAEKVVDELTEQKLEDLPDLGLRLSD